MIVNQNLFVRPQVTINRKLTSLYTLRFDLIGLYIVHQLRLQEIVTLLTFPFEHIFSFPNESW